MINIFFKGSNSTYMSFIQVHIKIVLIFLKENENPLYTLVILLWIYECHILHTLNASFDWFLISCWRIYINERLWDQLTLASVFWSGLTSGLGPSFEKCSPRLGNVPGSVWQWYLILWWLGEAILLFNHKIS